MNLFNGALFRPAPRPPVAHIPTHRQVLDMLAKPHLEPAARRERERIAQVLHDDVGQRLVLIRLKLETLRRADADESPALLADLVNLVREVSAITRSTTFDLATGTGPDTLWAQLKTLAGNLEAECGLQISVGPLQLPAELPAPVRHAVCGIVREFCVNAHRHARARHVRIVPRLTSRTLRVAVCDDGDGFAPGTPRVWQVRRDGGFGLSSAQQQLDALGGRLEIRSVPGRGATASLVLPWRAPQPSAQPGSAS